MSKKNVNRRKMKREYMYAEPIWNKQKGDYCKWYKEMFNL